MVTIVPRLFDGVTAAALRVEHVTSAPADPLDRQAWKSFGTTEQSREFVYCLFDEADDLLYVGITWNPFARWTRHATEKAWWPRVARVELYVCETVNDARTAETWVIKSLRPACNIHQAVTA